MMPKTLGTIAKNKQNTFLLTIIDIIKNIYFKDIILFLKYTYMITY